MERHQGLDRLRAVKVRVAGTGRSVVVLSAPTGAALGRALRDRHGMAGWVKRERGAWVFVPDRAGPVAPATKARLFLGRERYNALREQFPEWLEAVFGRLRLRMTASGMWAESAEPALLDELRRKVAEAMG